MAGQFGPAFSYCQNNKTSIYFSKERSDRAVKDQQGKKKSNAHVGISRRDFLRYTGTVVFVMGTGVYVHSENDSGKLKKVDNKRFGIPPSQGYLLVDIQKCQGCTSCMLACTLVHEGVENPSLSRIQIIQNSFASFPDDLTIEHCRQCVDPACVEACPAEAIQPNPEYGNVRMVEGEKCIGCGACIEACPFTPSRPVIVSDENYQGAMKVRKCDLCANTPYHWDEAGGGPEGKQACVEVCPVGAIQFTREIPRQEGDEGYKVNLRDVHWQILGYQKG
jgi:protein NrfC